MRLAASVLAILLLLARFGIAASPIDPTLKPGLDAITPDGMLGHIKALASDEFEGRAPGSHGEELTVQYIAKEFLKAGLAPGNPSGGYTQEVPLAGITTTPQVSFTVKDQTTSLKYPDDYVASSARLQKEIKVENSDIVFVGYGVV